MKKFAGLTLLTLIIGLMVGTTAAYAGIPEIPKPPYLPGPTVSSADPLSGRKAFGDTILPNYTVALIGIVGAAALIFLIVAGIRYAMAFGNEESVEKAKNQTIYALVGFVIALLSYTIVTIIINLEFDEDTSTGAMDTEEPAAPAPE